MIDRIKGWWLYSRTIFLNVASILLLVLNEITSYLVGADWASVIHNPKLLFFVTVGINVLNVVLRVVTTGPIGHRRDDP
jgi:hypothetical protein